MLYRVLAESILVVHFAFIAFALFGGFLVLRWRRVMFLQLPCLAWGVYIELSGGICPLTPLENRLRRAAGDAGYEGGFIEHYLTAIIYPDGLTHTMQLALAGILVALNATAYTLVIRKHRRANRAAVDAPVPD
ncbi:MAG: DUF2784 domain-containing protein [Phycisphaeraceae bacterium]